PSRTASHQTHQMGLPNSRRQSLAGDVAHGQSKGGVEFHHLEIVSREVAHGKNFAGDLKLAPDEFTRGAELPLNLGRLIDSLLQLCLFTSHCIQFLLHRLDARRKASCRDGQTLTRVPFAFRFPLQAVPERALPADQHSFCRCHHIHLILRICSPLRAPSERNGAALEPVRVSGESLQYEHPQSESLESSRNPRPRRANGRGSGSPPNDTENASAAQIPCSKTPPAYHHAKPGSCASSRRHHRRNSGPALSAASLPVAERPSRERAVLGSRSAW